MLQSSSRGVGGGIVTENSPGAPRAIDDAHHVGFILGPSIGGIMIDYFSWRWSFFLLAPVGFGGTLLALANMRRGLTRTSKPQSGGIDYLGAILLFAITSMVVFIFDRRTHQVVGAPMKLLLAGIFGAGLVGFLFHETHTKHPFVNISLFKIRRFSFSVISLLIIAMCYSLTGFLLPFYLQDILHMSPTKMGIMFMAPRFHVALRAERLPGRRLGPRLPRHARVYL